MNSCFKPSKVVVIGGLFGSLVGIMGGLTLTTQAQESASQEQKKALEIVTQLTMQQKPHYQQKGQFNTDVKGMAKALDINLPSSFNYGIRTGFNAAYIYVMPAKTPMADQLKSYVGAVAVNPNDKSKMSVIICENTKLGRYRPSDPRIVNGDQLSLECSQNSVVVSVPEEN